MPPSSPSVTELRMRIRTEADVVSARYQALYFAEDRGFGVKAQWEVAIAVSEAGTNMLKFAGEGEIVLRRYQNGRAGIEVEAIDRGPGIFEVENALLDGFSEGRQLDADLVLTHRRGMGSGLPAIQRMMDSMQISRPPEGGTRIVARKFLPMPAK